MNQFTMTEPRTVTRMAFQLLIATAASEGTRNDAMAGLQWYETKWKVQDHAARQAAAQAEQPPAPPPTPPSAVETHGINSEQAEAKREARRQKRLAEEAAKAEMPSGDKAEAT